MGLFSALSAPKSPFQPPTFAHRLLSSPLQTVISQIHRLLGALRGSAIRPADPPIRVLCISDTHTNKPALPVDDVDLLIHSGDLTNQGTVSELQAQIDWLDSLPVSNVVIIAGNHDSYFDARSRIASDKGKHLDLKRIHYLQHSKLKLKFPRKDNRELVIFGAPQIPACGGDDFAFQYQRQDDAWTGTLPLDLDILVTHTPPRWHLDLPVGVGCDFLLKEIWRVRPRVHVFGHVHAGRGKETVFWDRGQLAFEGLCEQRGWWKLLQPRVWLDAARVIVSDISGIIWTRIWGAEPDGVLMVNSALVDWKGNLCFDGHIIYI